MNPLTVDSCPYTSEVSTAKHDIPDHSVVKNATPLLLLMCDYENPHAHIISQVFTL